mgnify:CR=1 FL=1
MNINILEIGRNAGIVWHALENNRLSYEELVKVTNLTPIELASAIGWLARENKISICSDGGIVYFSIQQVWYF